MPATISLPKARYNLLKKRASLYEEILRFVPELRWGIEDYSEARIKAFMRADRITPAMRKKIATLLT